MAVNEDTHVDAVLDIALRIGMMILQNGGETYRTEETMTTIAAALGVSTASAFVTPTVVMLTCVGTDGQSHTRIQRISARTINLGTIARINALSRRLAARGRTSNLRQVENLLRRIQNTPRHHPIGVVFATAFASFCFSFLFKGSFREAVAAFVIGAFLRLILFLVAPLGLSDFFVSVIGGFAISFMSGAAVMTGFVPSAGTISISVLMTLVPGLAIVNAIRDIIAGDLVAGSARLMDAVVIAAALSLGAAFGLMPFPSGTSAVSALQTLDIPIPAFFLAFFASGSFAYFFNIDRSDIFWASLFGAVGWVAYLFASGDSAGAISGYLAGALCVGLFSEISAYILKKPATVFIVPGIIPLVPGGGMYETMLMAVWGKMDAAAVIGFRTLSAAAAIAVGIALVSSFARLAGRLRHSSVFRRRRS